MGCAQVKQSDTAQSMHFGSTTPFVVASNEFHDIFMLGRVLGAGSYGTVFLAFRNGETSAVKVIADSSARKDRCMERLHSECANWVLAGGHPNIVALKECFVDDNVGYCVMELCTASLLQAWKDEAKLNECTYARHFSDMAMALQHIHALGIVHRDIKHDNFMMGGPHNRTVKLCDFGLSCTQDDKRALARAAGTLQFMAPEALTPALGCGIAADVWSFGAIVYIAFFGRLPYHPRKLDIKSLVEEIRSGVTLPPFKPPPTLQQDSISQVAECFVRALLIRDQKGRASARECLKFYFLAKQSVCAPNSNPRATSAVCLRPMLKEAIKSGIFSKQKAANNSERHLLTVELMVKKQNMASIRRATNSSSSQEACLSRSNNSTYRGSRSADLFTIAEESECVQQHEVVTASKKIARAEVAMEL